MYDHDLIFDVGMANGDDTAHYLHRGYRVVAIEAHPETAQGCRDRFADAIREGRLTIIEAAIAPEAGIAQMVIDEQLPERNTLNAILPSTIGWANTTTHTIEVRAVRFRDVLAEYGVPAYLKIDIETFDHYCLEDLDPADLPPYVSFEASDIRDLFTMREKGYHQFKTIRQQDHGQAHFDVQVTRAAMDPKPAGLSSLIKSLGRSIRGRGGASEPAPPIPHYQPFADWTFECGQSGPFAEDTEGPWRSFSETALTWLAYESGLKSLDYPAGRWHDVHCRAPLADSHPIGVPTSRRQQAAA